MSEIYLMPDENGIWHKVEPIEWEPGKECEALNKAFEMGQKEADKRIEPLIKEIHDKVFAEGIAKGRADAKSNQIVDNLIELGYPHNFQHERSDIVEYMYAVTDIIREAYKIKEQSNE